MYPRGLTYYTTSLKNFSRNTFKLLPYRTDGILSNQIIVSELPPASLIDPASICLHSKITTSGTGYVGLPRHIEVLMSRIVVEINGMALQSCNNLEQVSNFLMQMASGQDFQSKRTAYASGGPQVAPTASVSAQPIKIQHFPGLLSSVRPNILDTSLLGSIRLHIYLSSAAVLPIASGATGAEFSLSSLYLTCDTMAIDDGTFYQIHSQYLSSGKSYSLLFDNYYTALFPASTPNQSARFSVATQSLDAVFAMFLPNNGVSSQINTNTGQSGYFDRKGDGVTSWNFTINNTLYPQYAADADDSYPLLMNMLGKTNDAVGGIDPLITTATKWKENFWVAGQGFTFNAADDDRLITGLNTLGANCSVSFTSTGSGTTNNLMLIVKTTSEIKVSAGKLLEIIT